MRDKNEEFRQRFARLRDRVDATDREGAFLLAASNDITTDEADELAVIFGWEPFTVKPSGPSFDPMNQAFWTPSMIISWIAYGSINVELVPSWRAKATRWKRAQDSKLEIARFEPMNFELLRKEAASKAALHATRTNQDVFKAEEAARRALDEAKEELSQSCKWGRLVMTAVEETPHEPIRHPRPRQELTPVEWQDLFFRVRMGADELRSMIGARGPIWVSPTAAATDVMRIWPASVGPEPIEQALPSISDAAAKRKGSLADARREWEAELAGFYSGTRPLRSQKQIEADYPTRFKVPRKTVREWIVGIRERGRPPGEETK